MPNIRYYLAALGNTILMEQIADPLLPDIDRVDFFRFADKYSSDALYIATCSDLSEASDSGMVLPKYLFLSASHGEFAEMMRFETAATNVIVSSMPQLELHAALSKVAATYRSWRKLFGRWDENCASITQQLVCDAARISGASIFVMNAGYQVDFYLLAPHADDILSLRLADEQYLPMEMIYRLFESSNIDWRKDYACIPGVTAAGGCCCHVLRLYEQGIVVGGILAVSQPNEMVDMETLLDYLGSVLMRNGIHLDIRTMPSKSRLQSMLGAILENAQADSEEFFHLLEGGKEEAKTGYVVVITEPEDRGRATLPCSELVRRLNLLLNNAFSVVYDGRIVSVITGIPVGPRSYNRIFRSGRENETRGMLKEYGAYMEIGIPTMRRDRLFTMYTTVRYMLKISRGMEAEENNRLFYEFENKMFLVIALGAERLSELVGHNDYVYLNIPNVMELARYDEANNQNLTQVLYYYLLYGCDIQKTSAALYMHRNTVKNKLDRIQKIVNIDYTDGSDRTKHLFGLLMNIYYEKCLGGKMQEKNEHRKRNV